MPPLALCEVDECKLCVSAHIRLNVAKLIGPSPPSSRWIMRLNIQENIPVLHSFSFHYFPSFFSLVSMAETEAFGLLLTKPEQNKKRKQAALE